MRPLFKPQSFGQDPMVKEEAEKYCAKFLAVVKSLSEFDDQKMKAVLAGQLNLSEKEKAFYGLYLRIRGYVLSVLRLDRHQDFQSVISLSRSVLEVAVDIKLLSIGKIADGVDKLFAFHNVQRLKAARKAVEMESKFGTDATIEKEWIKNNESKVELEHKRLWGTDKRGNPLKVDHWTGLDFTSRVKEAGGDFERWHGEHYARTNWHVHSGLAGFLGASEDALALAQGLGYALIAQCYSEVLSILVRQFQLSAPDQDIYRRLEFARKLPLVDSLEEAEALRQQLLG